MKITTKEIDDTNVDSIFREVYKWIDYNIDFELDLSEVSYMSSKAIWYIADLQCNFDQNKWELTLVLKDNSWLKDILEIVWITICCNCKII